MQWVTGYIQSYDLAGLWKEIESSQERQVQPVKMLLLAIFWRERGSALGYLAKYQHKHNDRLSLFAAALTAIYLGDEARFKLFKGQLGKNTPQWMQYWFDIVLYGRQAKFTKQIKLLEKGGNKALKFESGILSALLFCCDNGWVDRSRVNEWLNSLLEQGVEPSRDVSTLIFKLKILVDSQSNISEMPVLCRFVLDRYFREGKLIEYSKGGSELANNQQLNYFDIHKYLTLLVSLPAVASIDAIFGSYLKVVSSERPSQGLIAVAAIIHFWCQGRIADIKILVDNYAKLVLKERDARFKDSQVYLIYITRLCMAGAKMPELYKRVRGVRPLRVLGESHCLSSNNVVFPIQGCTMIGQSSLIVGITMHNLSNPDLSHHAYCFKEQLNICEKTEDSILITIGEIDTRPNGGIWKNSFLKGVSVNSVMSHTVQQYVDALEKNLQGFCSNRIIIQGVPAPNYSLDMLEATNELPAFLQMICSLNEKLKNLVVEKGWSFLDVYHATVGEAGISNKQWHIDGYHLAPSFYVQADKWLL